MHSFFIGGMISSLATTGAGQLRAGQSSAFRYCQRIDRFMLRPTARFGMFDGTVILVTVGPGDASVAGVGRLNVMPAPVVGTVHTSDVNLRSPWRTSPGGRSHVILRFL